MQFTENGALSLATTGSARVDLFFKTVRNTPIENLQGLLDASWRESPLDTLKLIFHLRDCRGGKGERKQFKECINWLLQNGHSRHVLTNLDNFEFYGSYKDLLCLFNTSIEPDMLTLFSKQLKADKQILIASKMLTEEFGDKSHHMEISLAAKWAPTEGCSHDRKFKAVSKFAKALSCDKKSYRKEYLVPLRAYLNIVEKSMCSGDWDSINYAHVPSIAMHKYRKIFAKHDEERFSKYLSDVAEGKTKINASACFPHDIVRPFLGTQRPIDTEKQTLELQWEALVKDVKNKLSNKGIKSAMSVVDVSGSMSGTPLEVAIALGLLLSEITEGPYRHKLVTFSTTPELFEVPEGTLAEKVTAINQMNWNMSTNLQAVFDLLLKTAKLYSVSQEQMPQTLFIFSDMQFNVACENNSRTNFAAIDAKYTAAGYTRPQIVFWNLRGDTVDFPVSVETPRTALVSGFSPSLMKLFVEGSDLNPYHVMRKAIDDTRYDRVKTHEETNTSDGWD
jgi:hypothetical protein